MTRILTALLIVVLVIPLAGVSDSAAAEGKRFKPRGRCVTVSNGRHRVRINCGRPKTNIEFGRFEFGVSLGDAVANAASPRPRRSQSTVETSAPPALSEAELLARYDRTGDNDLNCNDFDTQPEAQAAYDANPNDPFGLDGPEGPASAGIPGVPCEDLPGR